MSDQQHQARPFCGAVADEDEGAPGEVGWGLLDGPISPPSTPKPLADLFARRWRYFSTRPVCGELVHGCGLIPPLPCPPCLRTSGHSGPHDLWPLEPPSIQPLAAQTVPLPPMVADEAGEQP